MLTFAQANQKGTRQTQVFINLAENSCPPNFLHNQTLLRLRARRERDGILVDAACFR